MKYDPARHNRRSIRLTGYDYSRAGACFVTICAHNRKCLFGDIVNGAMRLNDAGHVAEKCWQAIPDHFPHATVDEFIVMPNHIHGIVFLNNHTVTNGGMVGMNGAVVAVGANAGANVGAKNFSPLRHPTPRGTSKTIGSIVRGFKIGVTKWIRQNANVHDVWQRNYWEHIVRDENELHRIRQYIINNPAKWETDRDHVGNGDRTGEPVARYGHEPWMV